MFRKQEIKRHINPRFRAYGKARIDIAQRAQSRADWNKLWKGPINPFPFEFGDFWNHCIEYKVDDFPAEVGFFIDVLGLPVNAFDPDYAMFTSPGREFFFAVVPAWDEPSTPPEALRIQFFVEDLQTLTSELERRGVEFEQEPQPCEPGADLYIGYFRTPHGIVVELWGWVDFEDEDQEELPEAIAAPDDSEEAEQELGEEEEATGEVQPAKSQAFDEFGEGEERIVSKYLPDIYDDVEDEDEDLVEIEEILVKPKPSFTQRPLTSTTVDQTTDFDEADDLDEEGVETEDDLEEEDDFEDEEDVEYVDDDYDYGDPLEDPWGKKYS